MRTRCPVRNLFHAIPEPGFFRPHDREPGQSVRADHGLVLDAAVPVERLAAARHRVL